ncbi:MAG: hypothetical protein KC620_18860, partial [Myxococcales bacterium]|nr:hypothetical protein [Myxococcales bacterium]
MGALIESTGINTDAEGSIARAIAAGKACLGAVGLEGDDVDVLINVGVYRDANMVEPAMAAHIQSGLGMSLDYARKPRAGFSFDLMNGACGVLNAVHVAGALLITGAAKRVLIVSGDGHPAKHSDHGDDFPYAGVGGAMLLAPGARPGCGFGRVSRRDGPAGDLGREGFVDLTETGPHGRDHITVRRSPGEIDALLDLATATAMDCLDEAGLAGGPALLLAPRLTADFGARLA